MNKGLWGPLNKCGVISEMQKTIPGADGRMGI